MPLRLRTAKYIQWLSRYQFVDHPIQRHPNSAKLMSNVTDPESHAGARQNQLPNAAFVAPGVTSAEALLRSNTPNLHPSRSNPEIVLGQPADRGFSFLRAAGSKLASLKS